MPCNQWNDPIRYFAYTRWHKINARTINGSNPDKKSRGNSHYIKQGVEIRFTRHEFKLWCESHRAMILSIQAGGDIASIDRVDSHGHYELNNMRIIMLRENTELGISKRNLIRTEKLKKEHQPKICQACRNVFKRKIRPSGLAECYRHYRARKFCNIKCANSVRKRDSMGRVK